MFNNKGCIQFHVNMDFSLSVKDKTNAPDSFTILRQLLYRNTMSVSYVLLEIS